MAAEYACSNTQLSFKKVTGQTAQKTRATQFESNDCHAQHAVVKGSGEYHAMIGLIWVPENLAKA